MRKIPIIELFLVIVTVWWSIILFNNITMLDNTPYLLKGLAEPGELVWGVIFVLTTVILLLGVVLESFALRKLGLFLCFFLYGLITAGYILADPFRTATGTYFAICLLSIYGTREVGDRVA
jgi:hypothetical protein